MARILKTFSEIAAKWSKYGVSLPKKGPLLYNFYAFSVKISEFREQFQNSRYVWHAANGHFYKNKWTKVICDVHPIKVN